MHKIYSWTPFNCLKKLQKITCLQNKCGGEKKEGKLLQAHMRAYIENTSWPLFLVPWKVPKSMPNT
jgi:hypothetical protein